MFEHLVSGCTCTGKRCTRCEVVQCIEGFHRHKYSSDGRRSACKACRKAESQTEEFKTKRRQHHKENAEHINEQKREWYHSNPERPRGYVRNYRENNPEKVKAYEQEYNRSERGKERDRRYRENNPEKVKETRQKSWHKHHDAYIAQMRAHHAYVRTQQTGAGGSFTAQEWEALKAHYNYTCPACGKREPEIQLTIDHKRPVSKQGASTIDNIQPLCLSCNSRKGTKIIDYGEEDNAKHYGQSA